MRLIQVKGNTWALTGWETIPLYKIDDHRCVLLDSGMCGMVEKLEANLLENNLIPVGVISTHAHIDHIGGNKLFQSKYGAQIVLPLGEAALVMSHMAIVCTNMTEESTKIANEPIYNEMICVPDRIIMPQENSVEVCGKTFEVIHTPGHSMDHICVRTPDDVLYLGDALMTGVTLHRSKFPFAMSMQEYFKSVEKLRDVPAAAYIAAHNGIYDNIETIADELLKVVPEKIVSYTRFVDDGIEVADFAARISTAFSITAEDAPNISYHITSAQSYLNYLCEIGKTEMYVKDGRILYRRRGNVFGI